jgi:hypothetical protein
MVKPFGPSDLWQPVSRKYTRLFVKTLEMAQAIALGE